MVDIFFLKRGVIFVCFFLCGIIFCDSDVLIIWVSGLEMILVVFFSKCGDMLLSLFDLLVFSCWRVFNVNDLFIILNLKFGSEWFIIWVNFFVLLLRFRDCFKCVIVDVKNMLKVFVIFLLLV